MSDSGALGSGLAIFSRFPIVNVSIHPYALNGHPVDVAAGDWMVGKAAASVLLQHPVLGEVELFNTHVHRFFSCLNSKLKILCRSSLQREGKCWIRSMCELIG